MLAGKASRGELATIMHLTASPCFGGPERQMLGLGESLRPVYESIYVTFREEERCWDFVHESRRRGFTTAVLENDTPHLFAAYRELLSVLRQHHNAVVFCHGYKADLLGYVAARREGIPCVAVSRGWTGESARVKAYEYLDRRVLRWMDRVVCVSHAQAERVRKAGVPTEKIVVIRNAIDPSRFSATLDPKYRNRLEAMFETRPRFVVGAAGRLSPEKGFDVLIRAAALTIEPQYDVGFVVFGDGPQRAKLRRQVHAAGLTGRFVLSGFTHELDRYMPHFDLFVQSSHTEGLPNILLEAGAATVPVIATNVGGTSELILNGQTGMLVDPGNAELLAHSIQTLLKHDSWRADLGAAGRAHVSTEFTFEVQADKYRELFRSLALLEPSVDSVVTASLAPECIS
jgi:glycosyltransferase involved in cell wall biosynthesis